MRLQAISCAYVKLIYYQILGKKKPFSERKALAGNTTEGKSNQWIAILIRFYACCNCTKILASSGVITGSPERSRLLFSISIDQLMSDCCAFRGLIGETPLPP